MQQPWEQVHSLPGPSHTPKRALFVMQGFTFLPSAENFPSMLMNFPALLWAAPGGFSMHSFPWTAEIPGVGRHILAAGTTFPHLHMSQPEFQVNCAPLILQMVSHKSSGIKWVSHSWQRKGKSNGMKWFVVLVLFFKFMYSLVENIFLISATNTQNAAGWTRCAVALYFPSFSSITYDISVFLHFYYIQNLVFFLFFFCCMDKVF